MIILVTNNAKFKHLGRRVEREFVPEKKKKTQKAQTHHFDNYVEMDAEVNPLMSITENINK